MDRLSGSSGSGSSLVDWCVLHFPNFACFQRAYWTTCSKWGLEVLCLTSTWNLRRRSCKCPMMKHTTASESSRPLKILPLCCVSKQSLPVHYVLQLLNSSALSRLQQDPVSQYDRFQTKLSVLLSAVATIPEQPFALFHHCCTPLRHKKRCSFFREENECDPRTADSSGRALNTGLLVRPHAAHSVSPGRSGRSSPEIIKALISCHARQRHPSITWTFSAPLLNVNELRNANRMVDKLFVLVAFFCVLPYQVNHTVVSELQ